MSRPLTIVADENMPNLQRLFGACGNITALPGRAICADDLVDCDILLVRSVTRVDAALLAASPVQFVGSATIGTDHIDRDYLASRQIAFAHAPGCNAASVVQYDLAALALLRPGWRSARIGVLGGGNVGSRVAAQLAALGAAVVVCDPLLRQTDSGQRLVGLESLLGCDIVLLHAPLTTTGSHPTHHLIGAAELAALRSGALLLNAGRGGVIDNRALLEFLQGGAALTVALDVWEDEPQINHELVEQVALATPHIAGYSDQGRSNGSAMVAAELYSYLGLAIGALGEQRPAPLALGEMTDLNTAIIASYDPRQDDRRLRAALAGCRDAAGRAAAFDQLRRDYPKRLEFDHFSVASGQPGLRSALAAVGFVTEQD
jgi:erythronate-4-phosphate dehydrogenase